MCNRARLSAEPETLRTQFSARWTTNIFVPNRPLTELAPRSQAYVVRLEEGAAALDVMRWDLLGGTAAYPITNVRDVGRWRARLENPAFRCLIPVTEFCEWTPDRHRVGEGSPIKGEMWFGVPGQPIFAIAGVWQTLGDQRWCAMMTCEPNELVAPIHPKAMVTILAEDDQERWLTGSFDDVVALQAPYPADKMTVRGPVFPSRRPGDK